RERGECQPEDAGRCDRGEPGQPEVPAVVLDEDRRDVRPDGEERRLAEVELSGIAEHQVEREREQHVHRAQHQDAAPVWGLKHPRNYSDEENADEKNPGLSQTFSSLRSAMRPVGRTTSMTSSSTNITRSMRPEPRYCTVKASTTP